jgi:hypothetical protein
MVKRGLLCNLNAGIGKHLYIDSRELAEFTRESPTMSLSTSVPQAEESPSNAIKRIEAKLDALLALWR